MKTKKIYLVLVVLSMITWSCTTQNDITSHSLKTSISSSAQSLITALNTITSSAGYQVLSASGATSSPSNSKVQVMAFDSTFNSIMLADISGVYDYKAASFKKWDPSFLHFFVRTADSPDMIVRLPESKLKNPRTLFHYSAADSTLVNNYVIDLSDYQYKFNRYLGWDYKLVSTISVSSVTAGTLNILSSKNKTDGYHFSSDFVFANGYDAKTSYSSGDTIVSTYNISKAGATLYEEKFTAIRTSATSRHREKEYSLTIGNVQIVRTGGPTSMDSAKVYVSGVLQLHSIVKFNDTPSTSTDEDSTETCITNHKRDLQITFDDGTSTTVSQLLGSTINNISVLFTSLRQTYFATNIVDYVAWDIYMNKNHN